MSVTFTPRNRSIGPFTMGTGSWGYLLGLAGPVIPGFWTRRGRWYRVLGWNPRFKDPDYPEILGDSGRKFYIRASEAKVLARVARNWAMIQQHLPEENRFDPSLEEWQRPFPEKVRDDWPPLFLSFADWAELSRGFTK